MHISFEKQIIHKIEEVLDKFSDRGFEVTTIHGDNEFDVKYIKEYFLPVMTHIYGKGEHVGIIERTIRVIK